MSDSFKIALIALYDWNALGVRTLHSVLKKNNIDVASVFFKLSNPNNTMNSATGADMDALVRLLKEIKATLVAISLRSTMFKLSAAITEKVKKELGARVLWGGFHPTIEPQQALEYADFVCRGEGERPLIELCQKLSSRLDYTGIGNLWMKENGSVIKNDLYPLIDDLDSIPAADFTNEDKYLIERGKILELPALDDRAEYDIMTSRGCPFACTYCCNNIYVKIYKGLGRIVRRRSVENVIEELQNAKKTFKSLSYIYFYDDVFTTDKNWIEKFSRQYRSRINLPFFCYTHPACADGDTFHLLKEAGLRDVTMGIQTGSKSVRELYLKRPGSNDKIMELACLFKRQRINVSYDVLMDNPFENEEDKNQTLQLLLSLPRPFQLHTHSLTYFPQTELTKRALENGYITEADVEDQKQKSLKTWTSTLDLSRDKADLFWDNLYYMAKKRYFSKRFIISLSQSRFFRKYPQCLTFVLKTFTYDIHSVSTGRFKIIYLVFNGLKMLFSGEFSRFKSHLKMHLKRKFD